MTRPLDELRVGSRFYLPSCEKRGKLLKICEGRAVVRYRERREPKQIERRNGTIAHIRGGESWTKPVSVSLGTSVEPGWPTPERAETKPHVVQTRRCKRTGTKVSVAYRLHESEDPENKWETICEDHGGVVCHPTKRLAKSWAARPDEWCPGCKGEA
jgi:hypothetical protein